MRFPLRVAAFVATLLVAFALAPASPSQAAPPATRDVLLDNATGGPRTILAVAVVGTGWTMDAVELPVRLEAGDAALISLRPGAGDAILTVHVDDPASPVMRVSVRSPEVQGGALPIVAHLDEAS